MEKPRRLGTFFDGQKVAKLRSQAQPWTQWPRCRQHRVWLSQRCEAAERSHNRVADIQCARDQSMDGAAAFSENTSTLQLFTGVGIKSSLRYKHWIKVNNVAFTDEKISRT